MLARRGKDPLHWHIGDTILLAQCKWHDEQAYVPIKHLVCCKRFYIWYAARGFTVSRGLHDLNKPISIHLNDAAINFEDCQWDQWKE